MITEQDLDNRFTYHPPTREQMDKYVKIREYAKGFSKLIVDLSSHSREQSLALTHLEEVVMWVNASIARE